MAGPNLYLYGVVPAGEAKAFGEVGIDGAEARTVPCGPLAAVTGPVEPLDFHRLDSDDALRYLGEHQRVLERVSAESTVIPVRFGTVAPGEPEVRRIVRAGREPLTRALQQYRGKKEMEVSAAWADLQATLGELAGHPSVTALKAEIAADGEPTAEQRVRMGRLVKSLLDSKRKEIASRLTAALETDWPEVITNPTRGDSAVFSAAVLIDSEDGDRFLQRVEQLERSREGRLDFRSAGPLPPYSFATASVRIVGGAELHRAAEQLGLSWPTDRSELKAAHRRLLRELHPDRSEEPGMGDQFKDISAAYELLESCLPAVEALPSGEVDREAPIVTVRSVRQLRSARGQHLGRAG